MKTVELMTGLINRPLVQSIQFYDLEKIKNLKPYFPTSFITTGFAIVNSKNTKRYLTPDEIKKLTIYGNSAFIFFLTGKESNSTRELLYFIANKGEITLTGEIKPGINYKYPLVCVIMTLEAENMYLVKDNPICSNMFISMRETSELPYDHQNPIIRNKTQASIISKIQSYNLNPKQKDAFSLGKTTRTLSLNRNENKESIITILTPEEYSTKILQELEISQK